MKYLAIAVLLLSTAAYAEDAKPVTGGDVTVTQSTAPASPTKPTPPYVFMLDDADLNIIAAGLNELQKKVADPFLMKLQKQLDHQADIKAEAGKGK